MAVLYILNKVVPKIIKCLCLYVMLFRELNIAKMVGEAIPINESIIISERGKIIEVFHMKFSRMALRKRLRYQTSNWYVEVDLTYGENERREII